MLVEISGSSMGSVRREEFDLGKGLDRFSEIETGAWSEMDWIPICASVIRWRSCWKVKM